MHSAVRSASNSCELRQWTHMASDRQHRLAMMAVSPPAGADGAAAGGAADRLVPVTLPVVLPPLPVTDFAAAATESEAFLTCFFTFAEAAPSLLCTPQWWSECETQCGGCRNANAPCSWPPANLLRSAGAAQQTQPVCMRLCATLQAVQLYMADLPLQQTSSRQLPLPSWLTCAWRWTPLPWSHSLGLCSRCSG